MMNDERIFYYLLCIIEIVNVASSSVVASHKKKGFPPHIHGLDKSAPSSLPVLIEMREVGR